MEYFICKTLSPEIFWTAFAAMGTLAAVLVALFMPWWINYRRANRLERLIMAEVKGNFQIIKNLIDQKAMEAPGGGQISIQQLCMIHTQRIDLRLWHHYKFDLAADRPESYQKIDTVNAHAEYIVNTINQPQQLQYMIQKDSSDSFLKSYKKHFGS